MYDRSKSIGASDAIYISEGRWAELYDQKISPDDLSAVLPVQIGIATEALNRQWFTQEMGLPVEYDNGWPDIPIRHPSYPFMAYTPDGLVEGSIPFEAKHVNPFWNPLRLKQKYNPQLQHQMAVVDAPYSYLSVFFGNQKYDVYKVERDPIFIEELYRQEELFMWLLTNQQRPPQ